MTKRKGKSQFQAHSKIPTRKADKKINGKPLPTPPKAKKPKKPKQSPMKKPSHAPKPSKTPKTSWAGTGSGAGVRIHSVTTGRMTSKSPNFEHRQKQPLMVPDIVEKLETVTSKVLQDMIAAYGWYDKRNPDHRSSDNNSWDVEDGPAHKTVFLVVGEYVDPRGNRIDYSGTGSIKYYPESRWALCLHKPQLMGLVYRRILPTRNLKAHLLDMDQDDSKACPHCYPRPLWSGTPKVDNRKAPGA